MVSTTMSIIGTAGRREDKDRLTYRHYDKMLAGVTSLIVHLGIDPKELKLVSGGAAWADHLVVTMALLGGVAYENLTVLLPAELGDTGFFSSDPKGEKTASTCNYYHKIFSQKTGKNSIRDLLDVRERGANLVDGKGSFFARNSDVAKAPGTDGVLLAYTFGSDDVIQQPIWTVRPHSPTVKADEAGLKDGGTADTWNKAVCRKFHGRLGEIGDLE